MPGGMDMLFIGYGNCYQDACYFLRASGKFEISQKLVKRFLVPEAPDKHMYTHGRKTAILFFVYICVCV